MSDPPVPSPVGDADKQRFGGASEKPRPPAGTGCEHQTLTLFSSGMHRCTNCLEALVVSSGRDEAAKFQAETLTTSFLSERLRHRPLPLSNCDRCGGLGEAVLVTGDEREWLCRRCLNGDPTPVPHFGGGTLRCWPAAVVSSSPATPPVCGRCGHEFGDHYFDTGSEDGQHGCMLRFGAGPCGCEPPSSPATPEGGQERGRVSAALMATGRVMRQVTGAESLAPSPASPAETREGRRPHLITKHPFVRDQYGDCAECGGAAEFHFSRMPTAGTGRMA